MRNMEEGEKRTWSMGESCGRVERALSTSNALETRLNFITAFMWGFHLFKRDCLVRIWTQLATWSATTLWWPNSYLHLPRTESRNIASMASSAYNPNPTIIKLPSRKQQSVSARSLWVAEPEDDGYDTDEVELIDRDEVFGTRFLAIHGFKLCPLSIASH